MIKDALGNPVVLGEWYAYSRNTQGWSHTTVGKADKAFDKTGKVRLMECQVKRYLYGEETDHRANEQAATVLIRGNMVFPIDIHRVSWIQRDS